MSLESPFNSTHPCFGLTVEECFYDSTPWEYKPSLALNGLLAGIFGLAAAAHLVQGIMGKTWGFAIAMVIGSIGEFPEPYRHMFNGNIYTDLEM